MQGANLSLLIFRMHKGSQTSIRGHKRVQGTGSEEGQHNGCGPSLDARFMNTSNDFLTKLPQKTQPYG